jgi:hypothetical protein
MSAVEQRGFRPTFGIYAFERRILQASFVFAGTGDYTQIVRIARAVSTRGARQSSPGWRTRSVRRPGVPAYRSISSDRAAPPLQHQAHPSCPNTKGTHGSAGVPPAFLRPRRPRSQEFLRRTDWAAAMREGSITTGPPVLPHCESRRPVLAPVGRFQRGRFPWFDAYAFQGSHSTFFVSPAGPETSI